MDNNNSKNAQLFNFLFYEQKNIEVHQHHDVELLYVLKGTIQLTIEEECFLLKKQDVVIINSSFKHGIKSEQEVMYVVFHFNYRKILELLHASKVFFLCNSSIEEKDQYAIIRKYVANILKFHYENQIPNGISLNSLYYQLLDLLIHHFSVTYTTEPGVVQHREEGRKSEIENYIESNYFKNIGLKEIADFLYLSAPYVSKYFKEQFGMNFYKYLNKVRFSHAINELLSTNHSITSIAMNNGFPNVSSFSKLFKEIYKNTPHDYRLKHMRQLHNEPSELPSNWRENVREILEAKEREENTRNVLDNASLLEVSGKDHTPFNKYWTKVINLNETIMLKNFSSKEQFILIKQQLGFEYGRIWNIFSKELKIFDGSKSDKFNFFNLERIFDFLMEHQIKPYIMLNPLEDIQHLDIKESTQEENVKKYTWILQSFISHVINRYGIKQVQEWYFEVVFNFEDNTVNETLYFRSFSLIKEGLYSFSPEFKVGGPGLPIHLSADRFKTFLAEWFLQAHQPDFLTLVSDFQSGLGIKEERELRRIMDAQYIQNQVLMVKRIVSDSGYEINDIQISNWDFNMSNQNMLNDSCYKAAYLINNIIDCYGHLQAMGYWYALDALSDLADTPNLLYGGSGLLSSQGLKKPSYYAYYFLNIGKGKYFLGKNKYSLMTTDGTDNYFIICHNCGSLNYKYYMDQMLSDKPMVYADFFEEETSLKLQFRIRNINNGVYKIKVRSVNEKYGSIQQEWMNLNMGQDLSNSEIEYLKQRAVPHMKIYQVEVSNGILELDAVLDLNEVKSIRVIYQH